MVVNTPVCVGDPGDRAEDCSPVPLPDSVTAAFGTRLPWASSTVTVSVVVDAPSAVTDPGARHQGRGGRRRGARIECHRGRLVHAAFGRGDRLGLRHRRGQRGGEHAVAHWWSRRSCRSCCRSRYPTASPPCRQPHCRGRPRPSPSAWWWTRRPPSPIPELATRVEVAAETGNATEVMKLGAKVGVRTGNRKLRRPSGRSIGYPQIVIAVEQDVLAVRCQIGVIARCADRKFRGPGGCSVRLPQTITDRWCPVLQKRRCCRGQSNRMGRVHPNRLLRPPTRCSSRGPVRDPKASLIAGINALEQHFAAQYRNAQGIEAIRRGASD